MWRLDQMPDDPGVDPEDRPPSKIVSGTAFFLGVFAVLAILGLLVRGV